MRIMSYIKNPCKIFAMFASRGYFKWVPDSLFLKLYYKAKMGKWPNLKNPMTFNEKIQWLKIYDHKDVYTDMVDKFHVKEFLTPIIGKEYIIPTLGVWDSFDEIDFEKLPNQFVLKCTHDSGGYVICNDKCNFDMVAARKKLSASLEHNYYWHTREWPYKNVVPRIIAEEFIGDNTDELIDYKFMCFNGKVKCIFTCSDRHNSKGLKVTFYDLDWNILPFERHYHRGNKIEKPQNFDKMIQLAEMISKDICFLRVDFYEVKGTLYIGELTFYPGSGFEEFNPEEWDLKLGSWINIS